MKRHSLTPTRSLRARWLAPLALALLGAAPLAACDPAEAGSGTTTSQSEARAAVARGALLLDVRTNGEFAGGHLDGATNIPVGELAARLAEVAAHKEIVVYCRSGRRSAAAAELLRSAGHTVIDIGTSANW